MTAELYKDPNAPVELRVKDLLSRMNLDEKIAQLGSIWSYELVDENGNLSREKAEILLKNGIGQITRPGGSTNFPAKQVAEFVNQIQKYLIEETRLAIPAIMHEECLSGYMGLGATNFPQPIAMASTWDPELIERMASTIREDMRQIGIHQGLAPVLDVVRDPRWGRTEESFGESAYLVAKMGSSYIKGLQGEDIREGIIATGKHFVGYGNAEGGKNWAPSNIPPRELREVFMLPFEAAVKEAGLLSIMNSYSEIDGIPCAASTQLLTEILRKEWGFNGIVVSDYFAIDMLREYHKLARDKEQAAEYALQAGIDVELPRMDCYKTIKKLVEQGLISESILNEAVSRVLRMKFLLGIFDKPYVETEKVDLKKHYTLATEVARKSIVLLKNDGILPLKKDIKVALIGPNASDVRNLLGDYSYLSHIRVMLDNVNQTTFNAPKFNLKDVERSVAENINKIPSIVDAVKEEKVSFIHAFGCDVTSNSTEGFSDALKAVNSADVAVVVVGDRSGLTKDCTSGESRDHANLKLPGVQEELVLEVAKVGKPVVLVLVSGRPYSLKNLIDKVNAIVEVWLPGEAGGRALVDVLFGKTNPGGKLPITFPRSAGQIPVYHDVKPSGGRSHWHKDYVDEQVEPLFCFGHGLSYTTFEFSNLTIEPQQIPVAGQVRIKVDVKNTGKIEGDEVVQLYLTREHASVTRPVKELKGFKRVTLEPSETKTVIFTVHTDILAYYNRDMKLVVEPGKFKVMVGNSSCDIKCIGEFEITGKTRELSTTRKFFSDVEVI
ncbi:MAG: glycoside hydrolase family 3 N-terminal domain-containing protein [Pseudothermotoga sp.]